MFAMISFVDIHEFIVLINVHRYVYFIVDPPHLLKTVRNAWANNKRRLWVRNMCCENCVPHVLRSKFLLQCNGKEIAWSHLIQLYYANRSQSNQINPGLALIPKLKYEHINLTSFSKMRVDLAAQVIYMHTCIYLNVYTYNRMHLYCRS